MTFATDTDTDAQLAGSTLLETVKTKIGNAFLAVYRAIERSQKLRAERYVEQARNGYHF